MWPASQNTSADWPRRAEAGATLSLLWRWRLQEAYVAEASGRLLST